MLDGAETRTPCESCGWVTCRGECESPTIESVAQVAVEPCDCGACDECLGRRCDYCDGTMGAHQRGCDLEGRCDCGEDSRGRVVECRSCSETRLGL